MQAKDVVVAWPKRIEMVIDRFAEGNRARFARDIGISQQAVHGLLGGSVPKGERLEAIAAAYPLLNVRFLVTGTGSLTVERIAEGTGYNRGAVAALLEAEEAVRELRARYGATRPDADAERMAPGEASASLPQRPRSSGTA
jgi:DNA transposition AAA+ family ATPase